MAKQGTSGVEPALLEAIQHARFHGKAEIALSLAFALERHRTGRPADSQPWEGARSGGDGGDGLRHAARPRSPGDGRAERT